MSPTQDTARANAYGLQKQEESNSQNTLVSWSKMAAKLEESKVPGVTDCIDQLLVATL